MPDPQNLLAFIAASIVLGFTPGPDILYVITRGAAQGAKAGIAAAAGLATGIVGHTALCVAGLSALLAASATAFTIIKWAGAAYLVWLGIRLWRDRGALDLADDGERSALGAVYRQTIVMNLLNPKVALFFLAFLPQFVSPGQGPVPVQLAVLGGVFLVVSFLVMSVAGLAGGALRRVLARDIRVAKWTRYGAGGVMIALGVRLLFEEAR